MITSDFVVYEQVVSRLKELQAPFITLRLRDPIPYNVKVVITTAEEAPQIRWEGEHLIVYDDPHATVDRAIGALRGQGHFDELVIGIDPGRRPGIAVLHGDTVVAVYQTGVAEVEPLLKKIEQEYHASISIVRIGSGARLMTAQIINALIEGGYKVELVDETGTTPYVGRGIHTSQVRDIIAAINIARIKGEPVGRMEVEPSRGEIRVIQESSRSLSEGRATIPKYLARRVAKGEITLDEAIEMHKESLNWVRETK
ncbi:hypothetical protein [Methanocella conradii]|uniref:hypothetical protein n=1 Tax=Methanocella conradii TaxID=1175444 RepID=UPI00157C307E|nr:hypothetical protein [Methanocella conradii]